jgi:hypothetical protein
MLGVEPPPSASKRPVTSIPGFVPATKDNVDQTSNYGSFYSRESPVTVVRDIIGNTDHTGTKKNSNSGLLNITLADLQHMIDPQLHEELSFVDKRPNERTSTMQPGLELALSMLNKYIAGMETSKSTTPESSAMNFPKEEEKTKVIAPGPSGLSTAVSKPETHYGSESDENLQTPAELPKETKAFFSTRSESSVVNTKARTTDSLTGDKNHRHQRRINAYRESKQLEEKTHKRCSSNYPR